MPVAPDLIRTRQSLLLRLKHWDDHASWEDFFNTYWRLIYNVGLRAGLRDHEAQDVVQETIVTVANSIKGFDVNPGRGSFRGWLMNITRWRIADQFRKRPPAQTHRRDETSRTSTANRIADPVSLELASVWDEEWKQSAFQSAVTVVKTRVRPLQYQLFDLHVVKEWPAQKVARKVGVSIGQVYFAKYKVSKLIAREVKRLDRQAF